MTDTLTRGATLPSQVQFVEPTDANAHRLWQYYQRAYRTDDDLFVRTCNPELGVDGLTESLGPEDVARAMRMPDTVTLEACAGDDCGGFVIVRYAPRDSQMRQAFIKYCLSDIFHEDALEFRDDRERDEFLHALEHDPVLCVDEFVSLEGKEVSAALLFATYQEVCLGRLAAPDCAFFCKCLDSVRIGQCTDLEGNRPVNALTGALGLKKIATSDQIRPLMISGQDDLLNRAGLEAIPGRSTKVEAVLTFSLNFGRVDSIIRCLRAHYRAVS
jgi:hypothetical protein